MSQHPDHRAPRDAGFTLPELLIAIVISGILIVSISVAFTTVLQTQSSATIRLAESKDITFVQTWVPVDLSSAILTFDDAEESVLLGKLAAVTLPDGTSSPMDYLAVLPGTNALTVVRPDLDAGGSTYYVVAYRYHQVGGKWQISRFEIRNPGNRGGTEVVKTVGVAHEIPGPPDGWNPAIDRPVHAVEVLTRNGGVIRPVGEDVTVNFESGNQFTTGGAGLSAENQLNTDYSGGFVDPSAPPSRCGGRIALVIDTSGSVPLNNGGGATEDAAVGFIDGFTGTPTSISINGFDREAYGMIWDPTRSPGPAPGIGRGSTNGERAPFVSVLNAGPSVDTMKKRITDLDDLDGIWPGGTASINSRDPNGDRIMWDQIGAGTNWEDGIWNVFRRTDGSDYGLDQPDLLVFITDGEPTTVRSGPDGGSINIVDPAPSNQKKAKRQEAADAAKDIADIGRGYGARVIGIMVGNKSGTAEYVDYLKDVVGSQEWNGTVAGDGTINVGNAAQADLFKGEFDRLGDILRSIMIAECGGTVTLQKRIDTGSGLENPATGVWSYTYDEGVRPLDRSKTSSITFDYRFASGEASKTVSIYEQAVAGYVFDRAECSVAGTSVPSSPNPDGTPGVTVTVRPDQAVSCLMISRPA